MERKISEVDFVVFDVETTGLNPLGGDRICEIGAARIRQGMIMEKFSSLVNPSMPMPRIASEIHHISDEMLKTAPRAQKVIPEFMEFIDGAHLVAYNAKFDLSFLEKELSRMNRSLPKGILAVDVLMMARRMLPDLEKYSLSFVSESLGMSDYQEHRALSDVEITAKLFKYLLKKIEDAGISKFKDFYNMFGIKRELKNEMNNYKEAAIARAIALGAKLKIKYFTASNAKLSTREVSPFEIKEESGARYLIGHCYLRKDERTFKIDHITEVELLEK